MARVRIVVDNNKCRVIGSAQIVAELHDNIKLKAPGYFFSPAYRRRVWDGFTRYVTESGTFNTGLIDLVIEELKRLKVKYSFEDDRKHFKDLHLVTQVGDLESRPYQLASVKSLLENEIEGVKFVRGILNEATNAGKNLIAASIYASFSNKRQGLFLIDNSVIYDQAKKELEELLPGQIGCIRGKDIRWNRITVCMVQSLSLLLKKNPQAKARLNKMDIVIVDECDSTVPKKSCQIILAQCFNAIVRVGLSGTALNHKHKTRNRVVQMYFGPIVHATTNKQLVEGGYSAKPYIRMIQGNTKHRYDGDYVKEYRRGIIKSKERNRIVWGIVTKQLKKKRGPVLILIKNHLHIKYLLKYMPEELVLSRTIESVHGKTMGREAIFEEFKKGKIDILIASMIIKRGKNLPSLKTLINAAGGDSESTVLQILGRGMRKQEGVKEKLWMYDFWDHGKFLRRHSNHRLRYYKTQGFPIKELFTK